MINWYLQNIYLHDKENAFYPKLDFFEDWKVKRIRFITLVIFQP